jgi:hypothetical protein
VLPSLAAGVDGSLVTGYRVTLTEKDQVDKPLNHKNTSKGNTTTTYIITRSISRKQWLSE